MTNDFSELRAKIKILEKVSFPWFVCGGWAIDLYLGRRTREHDDIDIGILRDFQVELRDELKGYQFIFLKEGKKYPWKPGVQLQLPVHQIEAQKGNEHLEILLSEVINQRWTYRRDPSITLPLLDMTESSGNIRYLNPTIVLLYKSKNTKTKDERDFKESLLKLSGEQKNWLKEALKRVDPNHHWIHQL